MITPPAHSGLPTLVPGATAFGPPSNPFSLAVSGASAFLGNVETNSDVIVGKSLGAQGDIVSNCGAHILSAKKNFDIPHPTKEGWRLRHTCPEGPSNDVYFRGKIRNKDKIYLPEYWKELVDPTTITVNLTPIGAHQNVIVKRIGENIVHLQANGGLPINSASSMYLELELMERDLFQNMKENLLQIIQAIMMSIQFLDTTTTLRRNNHVRSRFYT